MATATRLARSSPKQLDAYIKQLKADKQRGLLPKAVAFPDYSCSSGAAPCGNNLAGSTAARKPVLGAKQYPVANNHKQGYELVTPATLAAGHLKHMNGSKQ